MCKMRQFYQFLSLFFNTCHNSIGVSTSQVCSKQLWSSHNLSPQSSDSMFPRGTNCLVLIDVVTPKLVKLSPTVKLHSLQQVNEDVELLHALGEGFKKKYRNFPLRGGGVRNQKFSINCHNPSPSPSLKSKVKSQKDLECCWVLLLIQIKNKKFSFKILFWIVT